MQPSGILNTTDIDDTITATGTISYFGLGTLNVTDADDFSTTISNVIYTGTLNVTDVDDTLTGTAIQRGFLVYDHEPNTDVWGIISGNGVPYGIIYGEVVGVRAVVVLTKTSIVYDISLADATNTIEVDESRIYPSQEAASAVYEKLTA